jgi:hypothetical protein
VKERLGMSIRTFQQRVSLERKFWRFEELGPACFRGEISPAKANLVAKIAVGASEEEWIERARQVTLRELRAEVEGDIRVIQGTVCGHESQCPLPPPLPGVQMFSTSGGTEGQDPGKEPGTEPALDPQLSAKTGGPEPDLAGNPGSDAVPTSFPTQSTSMGKKQTDDRGNYSEHWVTIGFWGEPQLEDLWASALRMCRRMVKKEWEARTEKLRQAWKELKAQQEKERQRRWRAKLRRRAKKLKKGQDLYASYEHWRAAQDWDKHRDRQREREEYEELFTCPYFEDWQCANLILDHFLAVWPEEKPGELTLQREVYERDGWRCTVPGCTCTGPLNPHHIELRSQGGSDEKKNLTSVCFFHHIDFIHTGKIRVTGEAPDNLIWEIGIQDDGTPLYVYHGDVLVEASALL